MKTAGLIIGIILSVLSAIGIVICLVLVSTTNGRVSLEESMLVAIPLAVLFLVASVGTVIAAILILKARKTATNVRSTN